MNIGRIFGKFISLLTFIVSLSPISAPCSETKIRTVDLCSKQEIFISSKKSIGLEIQIKGLTPGLPIYLEISLSPTDHGSNPSANHLTNIVSEKINRVESDSLLLKRKIKLIDIQKYRLQPNYSQYWNIQLAWSQRSSQRVHRIGSASKTIQFVERRAQRLHRITGPMNCAWEMPVQLEWPIHSNFDQDKKKLPRSTSVYPGISHFYGADGVNQDHYRLQYPYLVVPTEIGRYGPFGSFYLANQKIQLIDTIQKSTMTWVLARGESGIFGSRLTFFRYPAVEYQKVRSNGFCSHWEATTEGWMDIGSENSALIPLPEDIVQKYRSNLQELTSYVQSEESSLRPAINTCDPNILSHIPLETSPLLQGHELIYFYPKDRNT